MCSATQTVVIFVRWFFDCRFTCIQASLATCCNTTCTFNENNGKGIVAFSIVIKLKLWFRPMTPIHKHQHTSLCGKINNAQFCLHFRQTKDERNGNCKQTSGIVYGSPVCSLFCFYQTSQLSYAHMFLHHVLKFFIYSKYFQELYR